MPLSSVYPRFYYRHTINKPAPFFHPILAALFISTLYKMEQGRPSVSMGAWVKALSMLGKLKDVDLLIGPKESLFARYEALEKIKNRQRAKRKS